MAANTDETVMTRAELPFYINYSQDVLITSSTVASLDQIPETGDVTQNAGGLFKKHERLLIIAGVAVAVFVAIKYI